MNSTSGPANRYAADKKSSGAGHIRNPTAGQWKASFTPRVEKHFLDRHEPILQRYGYM